MGLLLNLPLRKHNVSGSEAGVYWARSTQRNEENEALFKYQELYKSSIIKVGKNVAKGQTKERTYANIAWFWYCTFWFQDLF